MLALSIHAVFEGLAVGLEASSSNVWTMFAAIASHKYVHTFRIVFFLLFTISKQTINKQQCLFAAIASHKFVLSQIITFSAHL